MGNYAIRGCNWVLGLILLVVTTSSYSQIQFTEQTGPAGDFYFGESWGASWCDMDNDGLIDLFVNHHRLIPSLHRNNGNGTFTDIAQQVDGSGIWFNNPLLDHHGGAWSDYDEDGDEDLTIATGSCCPAQFFTNQNGVFVDDTAAKGIVDDGGGRMPFWFDYDRDSRIDLALMNSGTSKLMKQNNDGTFSVVGNNSSGFKCTGFRSNYSQLMDIDNDVAVGGTMEVMCMKDGLSPSRVYDIESIPYDDITASFPAEGAVVDTIIGDFDNNLSNDMLLLRGGLRFNEALKADNDEIEGRLQAGINSQRELSFTASGNVTIEFHSITTAKKGDNSRIFLGANGVNPPKVIGSTTNSIIFTVNPNNSAHQGIKPHSPGSNSGLYVGYDTNANEWLIQLNAANKGVRGYLEITAANSIGTPTIDPLLAVDQAMFPRLKMNNGGTLEEEAVARGLSSKIACVSGVAEDFDNDRDLDIYLVCRGGAQNLANRLYLNDGAGNFTLVNNAGGAEGVTGLALHDNAGIGDSVVSADYDNDGLVDVFVTNGLNLQPFQKGGGPEHLFRNSTNSSNHWIQIDLVGTASHIDAVGAKVLASAGGVDQLREQDGGYHRWSQDSQRIHFGLGSSQTVNLEIQWPSGNVDTYNNVDADKIYVATENTGIVELEIGDPPPPPGDECGQPNYNKETEKGIFIWKNCAITNSETWNFRATAGGNPTIITYEGMVTSDQNFLSLTPFSIEASFDTLDNSDPKKINYILKMLKKGQDGFGFSFNASADVCFDPTVLPSGAGVYLGSSKQPVTGSLNLITLEACEQLPPGGDDEECGEPNIIANSERDVFIWKDCAGSGDWYLKVSGGGSGTTLNFEGTVTSSNGFTRLTPSSVESNDVLDNTTNPNVIDYFFKTKLSRLDGFRFDFSGSSTACFDPVRMPSGSQVKIGVNKTVVSGSFDLDTQGACL